MKKWLLPCLALCLTACNPSGSLEKRANQERQKVARDYIQRLVAGDVAGLATEVEPRLRASAPRAFAEMHALLPGGAPTSVTLVGFGRNRAPQEKDFSFTMNYQLGYRDKWFLVVLDWRDRTGAPREITGLQVTALKQSLQETNALTFAHARPRHYAFLAAVILVPAFILVSLVTCIRMKRLPVKWVWIILILVGVVRFSLNWTSGALFIVPVSVQLFGAGVVAAGPYAPWIVSFSLPLGAMAFWVRRRQVLRAVAAGNPAV